MCISLWWQDVHTHPQHTSCFFICKVVWLFYSFIMKTLDENCLDCYLFNSSMLYVISSRWTLIYIQSFGSLFHGNPMNIFYKAPSNIWLRMFNIQFPVCWWKQSIWKVDIYISSEFASRLIVILLILAMKLRMLGYGNNNFYLFIYF